MKGTNGLHLAELRRRLLGNFDLLQALISIRLRGVEDPESRRHLNWLSDVVAALTLINRRLAATGMSDFGAYLIESVGFWRRVCEGREIGFTLDSTTVELPEELGSVLAMIVHELVADSVAHAFPDGRRGRISMSLAVTYGVLELVVADDGVSDRRQETAEGLVLARGLAEHLGGTFERRRGEGVTTVVRAPIGAASAPADGQPH